MDSKCGSSGHYFSSLGDVLPALTNGFVSTIHAGDIEEAASEPVWWSMDNEGAYSSELKLEASFTEAELPPKKDDSYYYPELQLEHRRDDILFWVIVKIALFLAACVAAGVFCFFHFFR